MARLLLDENLPRALIRLLKPPHDVRTVQEMRWSGVRNGSLLQRASVEFDVLITLDKGIPFQQSISHWPIAIIVLRARSGSLRDLRPLVEDLLRTIDKAEPGKAIFVSPSRE